MVEMQIVHSYGMVKVRVPGLPGRFLAKVEIGDRPLREVVNEALDRAEARLLFDEGWRAVDGFWSLDHKDRHPRDCSASVKVFIRELERAEAKAAESKHRATAQRLYDEGWRWDGNQIRRDGHTLLTSDHRTGELFKEIQEAPETRPRCTPDPKPDAYAIVHPSGTVQTCRTTRENAEKCIKRDYLGYKIEPLFRRDTPSVQETPETQPRWTMTKRQQYARHHDWHNPYMDGVPFSRKWGGWFEVDTPHDCPGMRENGPVVFLSESAAESRAASKVARTGDYLQACDGWYVRRDIGWYVCQNDPGLL